MLAIINRIVGMIPPLLLLGITVAAAIGFLAQSWRLDSCNRALGAAKAAVLTAKGVNERNGVVVASLQASTAACLDGRRIDQGRFTSARSAWELRRVELEAASTVERIREVEVYRDPACVDLAKLDISAVCPDLVTQWRERIANL